MLTPFWSLFYIVPRFLNKFSHCREKQVNIYFLIFRVVFLDWKFPNEFPILFQDVR